MSDFLANGAFSRVNWWVGVGRWVVNPLNNRVKGCGSSLASED